MNATAATEQEIATAIKNFQEARRQTQPFSLNKTTYRRLMKQWSARVDRAADQLIALGIDPKTIDAPTAYQLRQRAAAAAADTTQEA